ncbi:MAG: hypothetical protein ACYC4D_02985 [Thermoleophilia bacterium]
MKTTAMTLMIMMVTAAALFMAAPAMAWQAEDVWQPSKALSEDGIQLTEAVDDMQGLPGDVDEGDVPGCEDIGDPESLDCPGEDGVVPGDDEGIDDGSDDYIVPPDDIPEDTPGDNPGLTPPDDTIDTPDTSEAPPATPPATTTTSSLPKTGTYLLVLGGIGMLVAFGALGARVGIGRRMK